MEKKISLQDILEARKIMNAKTNKKDSKFISQLQVLYRRNGQINKKDFKHALIAARVR